MMKTRANAQQSDTKQLSDVTCANMGGVSPKTGKYMLVLVEISVGSRIALNMIKF